MKTSENCNLSISRVTRLLAISLVGASLAGCGSVVRSSRETALPDPKLPLKAIRYYLPRGRVQVSASWNILIPGWDPKIAPVIDGDPQACYELKRKVNVFFDDDISLAVDPATGLLQTAGANSTDESMAAIGNLAAGASAAMTFGANLGGGAAAGASRDKSKIKPAFPDPEIEAEYEDTTNQALFSCFSVYVDPHQPKQTCYLIEPNQGGGSGQMNQNKGAGSVSTGNPEETAAKLYAKYEITIQKVAPLNGQSSSLTEDEAGSPTNFEGIVVRVPVPYLVTVSAKFFRSGLQPMVQKPQDTQQIVFLPDDRQEYYVPLERIPFVTSSTKVAFKDGMVQSLQINRPSVVNSIAGIPKSILSALAPLPLSVNQNVQVVGSSASKSAGSNTSSGSTRSMPATGQ